jgi:2'-5' RNA ligase
MSKAVRAFIAIEIPETIRHELVKIQNTFKPLFQKAKVSWVQPSHLHLTLIFLGDIAYEAVAKIINGCRFIESATSFELTLGRIGFFPEAGKPRVLWFGYEPSEDLMQLQARMEASIEEAGFPAEKRKFSPHVTCARIKDLQFKEADRKALSDRISSCRFSFSHRAHAVTLFQSHLSSKGSTYTVLTKFDLAH